MLFLRWYFWIAPNLLLVPCLYGLIRTRRYRSVPWFTVFTAAQLVLFLASVLIGLTSTPFLALYRWVMDTLTAVSAIIELGVIYELADDLIVSRSSLSRVLRPLMRWTIAVLSLVAAASLAVFHQVGIDKAMKAFQVLDFSSSVLQVGLLVALLVFARALQISWRSLSAGVALGFAISASAELAAAPLFSELGPSYYGRIDILRLAGFHGGVLIWLIYIFLPRKPPSVTGHRPDRTDLEAWDQELQKMVR
jgi:hypothetical protein